MSNQINSKIKFVSSSVMCGFPSPADDYAEKTLDLHELLINHPSSTFFVRAKGESMIEGGINDGDILIVDRSLEPHNNNIIIAFINGEFTAKKYIKQNNEIYLFPQNKNYKPIKINENDDFLVWGVVTYTIHKNV